MSHPRMLGSDKHFYHGSAEAEASTVVGLARTVLTYAEASLSLTDTLLATA